MSDERELAAIVAHGLLNTTAVLSGAAHALRDFGDRLSDTQQQETLASISTHAWLLDDGFKLLLDHASESFAEAASAVVLAAMTIPTAPPTDLPFILDAIIERLPTVTRSLRHLVRGLPPEVVRLLDSIQRADGTTAAGTT